jgi:hypothetical protein
MEYEGNEANKEQYVDNQYVRERLMVSRTKAYEIMREIEGVYEPNAVFRYGRSLRVRKDVFWRWVAEQSVEEQHSCTNGFITRWWAAPHLRSVG